MCAHAVAPSLFSRSDAFAILGRCDFQILFETAVKIPQRAEAAAVGTLQDRLLRILHQIASVAKPIVGHISVERNTDGLSKVA